MPIYAYRCESCGHAQDVLQKMSDPVLTLCPSCGAHAYKKQVTAAGFQLKGTGWYVTDFRGGNGAGGKGAADPTADGKDKGAAPVEGAAKASDSKPATSGASERPQGRAAPSPPPAGDKKTWGGPAFSPESSSSSADTATPPPSAKPTSDTP